MLCVSNHVQNHMHKHAHPHPHACPPSIYACISNYPGTLVKQSAVTYIDTHRHMCSHMHTHACKHTHTHVHTHARTHTHTHRHGQHAPHTHTCTCTHRSMVSTHHCSAMKMLLSTMIPAVSLSQYLRLSRAARRHRRYTVRRHVLGGPQDMAGGGGRGHRVYGGWTWGGPGCMVGTRGCGWEGGCLGAHMCFAAVEKAYEGVGGGAGA